MMGARFYRPSRRHYNEQFLEARNHSDYYRAITRGRAVLLKMIRGSLK